jgi:hypothetical protein
MTTATGREHEKAVDEFMAARGISADLRYLDYTGRQFVKP